MINICDHNKLDKINLKFQEYFMSISLLFLQENRSDRFKNHLYKCHKSLERYEM